MAPEVISKRTYYLPVALFIALLVSLYLMSDATQASSQFNELFSALIVLNVVGTIFLFGLLVSNIGWLWGQFKKQAVGSKMTARIVALFLAVSLIPTGTVFYFSNKLLHQSIDSWFDVQIDGAMQDALQLSQRSLDGRTRQLLKATRQLAGELAGESDIFISLTLDDLRAQANAQELTVLSKQGQIIATTNLDPRVLVPNTPDSAILLQVKQGSEYIGLEPHQDTGLRIRSVVALTNSNPPRYLQAIYAVPDDISHLATSVSTAYAAYKELSYLRQSLKFSFSLTLSLVLLFSLLAASWAAFIFARQLVAPIRELVKGTQSVAKGDYEKKLNVTRNDELGFLITSFNDMTSRISNSRKEAQLAQRSVEDQHAYLETILAHLSNGVLSFDLAYKLRTSNEGANQILGIDLSACTGLSLNVITKKLPSILDVTSLLAERLPLTQTEWRHEITFQNEHQKKTLLFKGTPLLASDNSLSGYIVVFDDVTPIIQSQRNAAWGEVARRLAHEIKNPLTPIQLSAERLQRKLGKEELSLENELILNKSTRTIVQQVSALKSMVDDFSDFARPQKTKLQSINLGNFIDEVLSLYQGQIKHLAINIETPLPKIHADIVRLRQVLVNLIKNAQEAISETPDGSIDVSVSSINNGSFVKISIADNGSGVDNSILENIFEPYVTSKTKGTGLGLAVVKKIIDEHSGKIYVKPNVQQGTIFCIELPATANSPVQTIDTNLRA